MRTRTASKTTPPPLRSVASASQPPRKRAKQKTSPPPFKSPSPTPDESPTAAPTRIMVEPSRPEGKPSRLETVPDALLISAADQEVGDVTRTDFRLPNAGEPTLDPETRAIILTCEAELETKPDALRAARLHYEIAQAYEGASGWTADAAKHYEQALEKAPDHVPTIRGARRMQIALARFDDALELYDAEAKLTSDSKRTAMLLFEQGRLIEDIVGDVARAREVYSKALELDPGNPSLLKALEQCDYQTESYDGLLATYEQTANAVSEDARHRAAVIAQRARLVEWHAKDSAVAAELYESALKLDPHAIGALAAVERLYHSSKEWRSLTTAFERESRQSNEDSVRALALYQVARAHGERLGNRAEALSALAKAAASVPRDPLVLEDLTRLYTEQEDYEALADALEIRVQIAAEKGERADLLYELGQVYEWALENVDKAIECYRAALDTSPTHLPVLQALGKLLTKRLQWAELVEMYAAEAEATDSAEKEARAHERIAEIQENHLRSPDKAAEHHARALTLVPGYPPSFKALTRLYAEAQRFRELIELYERAIDETRDKPIKLAYLFKVGRLWEDELDNPAQALFAFRRAFQVDSGNMAAIHAVQRTAERAERYQDLVEALELEVARTESDERKVGLLQRAGTVLDEHLNDRDGALARFDRALAINPGFIPALGSIGEIYYRLGRWANLLQIYERELAATPEGPEAVALLTKMGKLCEKQLGNRDSAIAYYRRAAEMDSTYRPALRALAQNLRDKGDWAGLASALELEVKGLSLAATRAITWYRVGQVYEERLDDLPQATAAYEKALLESQYRPARVALIRLYGQAGEWMKVIDALASDMAGTEEPIRIVNALMQQGEIYRDELGDSELAIHCFEAVLQHDVGRIPAFLALEPLYLKANAWVKLARVYDELGAMLAAPAARIAALRELARLQETRGIGGVAERLATQEAILAIDPDDHPALITLERIGRETSDNKILIRAYSRLSEITEHDTLAASYLTRLGQTLEHIGDRRALKAYRAAVQKDSQLLTAIRGLSRVGDLLGDARAMSHSARLEAQLTRKPEMAAKLFVRAGTIRLEQMNDLGAVEDFEQALEVWPDDAEAAERIVAPLLDTGQIQHLVDVLSQAAVAAKSAQRKTALGLEVGRLYTERLDNLSAGIASLQRALRATPGHVATQSELATAYERNKQWGEAVAALEQVLALTSDDTVRCQAHLKLASIFDERLKSMDRARKNVQAVLRKHPQHADALLRLADIQLRSGDEAEAVQTAEKLVELARDPRKKGAALVRVARIQRARGETTAADEALTEALALEGPGGDAEVEFKKSIHKHGSWVGYAAGIAAHITRARQTGDASKNGEIAAAYLELAKTYGQGMSLPNKAVDTLREGLSATGNDGRLTRALATELREAERFDEALTLLKQLVSQEPTRPDSWSELAVTFDRAGRPDDAVRTMSALRVLGSRDNSAPETISTHKPRSARAVEGSFSFDAMCSLAVEQANSNSAARLLGAIAEGIGKIYPSTLESFGLSRRDRIGPRSNHPLWDLTQRIAQIFGADTELYEHAMREPILTIELTEPAAIVVSSQVRAMPVGQQAFLLAYAMGPIAGRIHPALSLNSTQIEVLLAGAARTVSPGFAAGSLHEDELDDAKERLRRLVPRKWRRAMEVAATELISDKPRPDFSRWQVAVKQTAARAALLVADDLAGSLEALHFVADLGGMKGTALVHGSSRVRDLMQFWISDRAATLRRRSGIVGRRS